MSESPLSDREAAYRAHKGYVLRVLAKRCPWIAPADRESLYHEAYALLLAKERDGELEPAEMASGQVRQYLVRAAVYKALDEGKSAERRRTEPLGDAAFRRPEDGQPFEERAQVELDSAPVRELVAELPERQQTIIRLRFSLELAPNEIQAFLRISNRAYRKDLERALRTISERYELVREGRWCESRKSLVLAYVAGIAGPNKAAEARLHLSSCPACALWAVELREATERAAAVLPTPDIATGDGVFHRTFELASSLKSQAIDLATGTKQQATAVASRLDPSSGNYIGAARPGTVAAAVVGCMAVGGGAATYCAVEGVPNPLRSEASVAADREPAEARAPGPAIQLPTPATAGPTVPPKADPGEATGEVPKLDPDQVAPAPASSAPAPPQPGPTSRTPPAAEEFGFDGSGASSAASGSGGDAGSGFAPGGGASGGGGAEFGP